jgi:predicted double-glycine peptidase
MMKAQMKASVAIYAIVMGIVASLGAGCATSHGNSTPAQTVASEGGGQWKMVQNIPLVRQSSGDDCGAAALASVVSYWGYPASVQSIEAALGRTDHRLQAGDMEAYARSVGLRSYVFYGTMKDVVHELERGRPVIVGLGKMIEDKKALSHYEVVVGWEPQQKRVLLLDPARGFSTSSLDDFAKEWAVSKAVTMVTFPDSAVVPSDDGHDRVLKLGSAAYERAIGTRVEQDSYAARETTSAEAKKYRAGDVIVISGTALAIILLVVLIIVLV